MPCTFIGPAPRPAPPQRRPFRRSHITRQPSAPSKAGISEALSVTSPKRTKATSGSSGNEGPPEGPALDYAAPAGNKLPYHRAAREAVAPVTMYSALQRPVIYGKARLWRGPREAPRREPVKLPLHASYPLGGHRAEMQQRYAGV